MRTVKEVSKLTGVSVRTLHYYDSIGLLRPTTVTESGYRMYDDTALERLQQILLFRELEFPLKEIKNIIESEGFDTKKIDEYCKRAKESWGKTDAYQEFEEKTKNRSVEQENSIAQGVMELFVDFAGIKDMDPAGEAAQTQVEKLRAYYTEHYYNCTPQILAMLGKLYSGGGEFTENINNYAGEGTAEFAAKAIEIYCAKQ